MKDHNVRDTRKTHTSSPEDGANQTKSGRTPDRDHRQEFTPEGRSMTPDPLAHQSKGKRKSMADES